MKSNLRTYYIERHVHQGVAFGIGVLIGGIATFLWGSLSIDWDNHRVGNMVASEVAAPIALTVPSVEIAVPFGEALGVNPDQTVEVPDDFTSVGWFSYGPKPGEIGPAVVLGHVDSVDGPSVFYNLRNVSVGDAVLVDRADGTTATFVVTRKQYRSQDTFPTEEVYGDLPYPGLRLITCSGSYSGSDNAYSHNLIVYATFVSEAPTNS